MRPDTEFRIEDNMATGHTGSLTPLLAIGLALIAILAVYWDTAAAVASVWRRSETFAHGFLVIPISLWLVWRQRKSLARVSARPFWLGLGVVAAAGFGWMVGELAGVAGLAQFGLLFMLIATVVTVLGIKVSGDLTFPLAFLLFAVPVGEFLVPSLMDLTADFTVTALQLSGVPVYREGNEFLIPSGKWSVVEACSGIRYLIASAMVGTLYAYLTYRSPLRRAVFVAASFVVPIAANWFRAYLIVMLGHLSGNKVAVGVDHLIYGWVFFGVVIFVMFWIGSFWREDDLRTAAEGREAPPVPPPAWPVSKRAFLGAALASIAVASLWRPVGAALEAHAQRAVSGIAPIESAADGWSPQAAPIAAWRPHFEGASAELQQAFTKDGRQVGLYIAYYAGQTQGRELIASGNTLVLSDDPGWRRAGSGADTLPWDASDVHARSAVLSGHGLKLDVRYVYWVDGRWTSSDVVAKALLGLAKLLARGDDSAVVVLYTQVTEPPTASSTSLHDFAKDMSPAIAAALARTRER